MSKSPKPPGRRPAMSQNELFVRWIMLGGLLILGFAFGLWAGTQESKPRPTETAKAAPSETPKPVEKVPPKVVPKAEPKPEPEPPKAEPKAEPKVEPKVEAKAPPKVEPKKVEPKAEPKASGPEILFTKQVLPVVRSKCLTCHGDPKKEGGFDMRTVAAILKGGDSGDAIKPGDPSKGSLMVQIDDGTMPPAGKPPLTADEKKLFRDWISGGAK